MGRTTKDINGSCCGHIPAGTEFQITFVGETYTNCKCSNFPLYSLWNTEYEEITKEPEFLNQAINI